MAAQIKEYKQRTNTPLAGGVPRAVAQPSEIGGLDARAASDVARGSRDLAFALKEREDEQARAWTAEAVSKARLDWTTELLNRQEKASPDVTDFTPTVLADFDKYAEQALTNAPNDASRFFLNERLGDLRATIGTQAQHFEAQARIDYRDDRFRQAGDNVAKLMNTDPGQYQVALAELLATVDASAMPPKVKSARREAIVKNVSSAAVWSQIQRSPQRFLESIGFVNADGAGPDGKLRRNSGEVFGVTGNVAFDALPFERRTQMLEQALRLKAQIDMDADKATSAKRKQIADDAMKEGWSRFYSGKLDRGYIESVRALVDDKEYKSLLEAHRKGLGEGRGQKTDPDTYRQLQRLMADGKYSEAVDFAFTAHRNGLLSNEHLGSEVAAARRDSRQEGPKSEYERTRNYIRGKLEPSPMIHDPVAKGRYADAIDVYDRWYSAGPGGKRTDEEIEKRGREIVSQYLFVNLSDTVLSLPVPRGTTIRRSTDPKVLGADIAAAGHKLQRDRDEKRLTEAEYNLEMQTLVRWKQQLDAAREAQAQREQKK